MFIEGGIIDFHKNIELEYKIISTTKVMLDKINCFTMQGSSAKLECTQNKIEKYIWRSLDITKFNSITKSYAFELYTILN